jgi:hypothetical protein
VIDMTEQQLRKKVVDIAVSYLGCNESDGSHKKIIDIYNSHKPLAVGYAVKYTDAWCSTFASSVAIEAGLTDIIPTECGCERHVKLFQNLGSWIENDGYGAEPGDYIFYDWDDDGVGDCTGSADHVGIVTASTDTTLTVIEGNKNDAVGYRTIPIDGRYIRGFGVPNYKSKSTETDEVKQEEKKVVGGNSPLVSYTKISPNKTVGRNHSIDTITIHCVVGQCSVETLGNVFAPTSRQASSNYGVGVDGRIGMYVEEKDRSWCSSSGVNDNRAITIEVASDTTHPYAVNEKAYAALIELCADICKRNGISELKWQADKSLIGQVDKQNMTVHRWFANKSCPGDYLYNRHYDIAEKVNAILKANEQEPEKGGNTPDSWAKDAVENAINRGILYGDGNGNLKLHNKCTRQEMVVFLYRYYKYIMKNI